MAAGGTPIYFGPHGAIAQLGERLDRTQEVSGSNPLSSMAAWRPRTGLQAAIPLCDPGC